MEPLRGGAFGRMAQELVDQLKAVRPDDSTARWAFRWVGSYPNILTTLSGMNRMDHLEENVQTFSPLEICTEAENVVYLRFPARPANTACLVLTMSISLVTLPITMKP